MHNAQVSLEFLKLENEIFKASGTGTYLVGMKMKNEFRRKSKISLKRENPS